MPLFRLCHGNALFMRAVIVVVVVANSDRSEAVEHAARDTTRFSPTSILRNRSEETAYPWPLENIFLQILTAHKNYISEELPFKRLNVQFIEYRALYREVEWNKLEFAGIF